MKNCNQEDSDSVWRLFVKFCMINLSLSSILIIDEDKNGP